MPTGERGQRGFTYLYVLLMIALVSLGLAAAGTVWRTEARRANEAELLFVGAQYRQAIESYYTLDPGLPRLPQSVADLLEDRRRPEPVRHLRRAYRDPITGREMQSIVAEGEGIVGMMSAAPGRPLKQAGFPPEEQDFSDAESYAEWRFVFVPPTAPRADGAFPDAAGAPGPALDGSGRMDAPIEPGYPR
ncbi:conserved hypothetical protein [Thiobacillus denitrificans ATCC 25259]|uniref:Type II secretory pathway, pseudopilin PulG n=1 Tax=Thiobacillus denitrificans (strain ATCC 25259 / T1) TaxID=292415 RepID=Q3SIY0_THIDA|nr:type II secretion system protein [Thiobacillus denitrificans]AAZ97395.1 conserved hypothetical protein [Thiobacillus denitrificans ATCC 25259]